MLDKYGNHITWIPTWETGKEPLYIAIANCLEQDIKSGVLEGGFKLPPQRVIANYLEINHSTITRAYKLCEEKGLIKGVTGKGTYVNFYAQIPQNLLINNNSAIIEMGAVLPLYQFNAAIELFLKEACQNIDYSSILQYTPPEGHIKHRYIAARWLSRFSLDYSPEQIIITAGTQNALAAILVSLFRKGERIIVDEYTYTGLISLAKLLGVILVPVKTTKDGIDINELRLTVKRETAKGIYLIPDCHNPTTATLSKDKRAKIAQIIEENKLLLIEDSPFSFTGQNNYYPLSRYIPESSIYIAGFSKSINPTFRISFIAAPRKYIKELSHGINNLLCIASPLTAELISQLLNSSKYDDLITAKVANIKERNQLVDAILGDYQLIPSQTALFRYLTLPQSISDSHIELSCLERGVQIFSSKRFSISTHPSHNAIRLSTSGPKDIEELQRGLILIREVLSSSDMTKII